MLPVVPHICGAGHGRGWHCNTLATWHALVLQGWPCKVDPGPLQGPARRLASNQGGHGMAWHGMACTQQAQQAQQAGRTSSNLECGRPPRDVTATRESTTAK